MSQNIYNMDIRATNGFPHRPVPSSGDENKPPRLGNAGKQASSTHSERQKLYDSITDSTQGTRRYSAGDTRPTTATMRNISHSTEVGYPSSVPRDDPPLATLEEEMARDPRDRASPLTPVSPTPSNGVYNERPTVDFDGLSWPSEFYLCAAQVLANTRL